MGASSHQKPAPDDVRRCRRAREGLLGVPATEGNLLVVFDPEVVAALDCRFQEDVERSEPVKPGWWEDRPLTQRAKEKVASLIDEHV